MPPVPTSEILLKKALQSAAGKDCVEWAFGLLESGVDTPNLRILAGKTEPYNSFEMERLRDRVLEDLNIVALPLLEAATGYLLEKFERALRGELNMIHALNEAKNLWYETGNARELNDLAMLYFAHDDLAAGHDQWYWKNATKDNIQDIIRDEMQKFVREHRKS